MSIYYFVSGSIQKNFSPEYTVIYAIRIKFALHNFVLFGSLLINIKKKTSYIRIMCRIKYSRLFYRMIRILENPQCERIPIVIAYSIPCQI